jgi:hypothetical protein
MMVKDLNVQVRKRYYHIVDQNGGYHGVNYDRFCDARNDAIAIVWETDELGLMLKVIPGTKLDVEKVFPT